MEVSKGIETRPSTRRVYSISWSISHAINSHPNRSDKIMKLVRYIYFLCVYAVYLVYVCNNAVHQFVLVSVMSCAREMVSCSVVACICLHNYIHMCGCI